MSTTISHRHWKNGTGGGFSAVLGYEPDPPLTFDDLKQQLRSIYLFIQGIKKGYPHSLNDPGFRQLLRQKETEAKKLRARIAKVKSLGDCAAP